MRLKIDPVGSGIVKLNKSLWHQSPLTQQIHVVVCCVGADTLVGP